MKQKEIWSADIAVKIKKGTLILENQVITLPYEDKYFRRMSTLKKYGLKDPPEIINIKLNKQIGLTNYET